MSQNTSSAVMQQRSEPHDSLDFFPTLPWATRALCVHILRDAVSGRSVWEPACGEGHMVRPLQEYFASVRGSVIAQFSERVPMFKGKLDATGSTATAYCWLVWTKDVPGTTFVWIPPCRRQLERPGDYA